MGFDSERGMEIETGKRIARGMEKVRVRGIEVERGRKQYIRKGASFESGKMSEN